MKNIIGHSEANKLLQAHSNSPRTSYIFHGPDGVGKCHVAKEFFRYVACKTKAEDCTCKECYQFKTGNHPDLRVLFPEGGKSYGIAQIQELIEDAQNYPDSAPYKFYILQEGSSLTPNAANALLKILEEGPIRSVFIFCLEDESQLLNTIRSRSISIRFAPLSVETIATYLSKFDRDQAKIQLCANLSGGSIGVALENLRSGRLSVRDSALELIQTLPKRPLHQLNLIINEMDNPESLFCLLRSLFTDLVYIQSGLKERVANFDCLDQLESVLKHFSKESLKTCVEHLNTLYSKQGLIKATFPSHLKVVILQLKRSMRG